VILHFLCWGFPAITVGLDLSLHVYGITEGGWCWIQIGAPSWVFLRYLFYVICVAALVIITILYGFMHFYIAKKNTKDLPLTERKANASLKRKFLFFVLAYFFANIWALINRIQNATNPNHPSYTLYALHAAIQPAQGFFNALVYGSLVFTKLEVVTKVKELKFRIAGRFGKNNQETAPLLPPTTDQSVNNNNSTASVLSPAPAIRSANNSIIFGGGSI